MSADATLLSDLAREFRARHPEEAARALERRPGEEIVRVFEEDESAAPLLGRLAPDLGARVLEELSDDAARRAIVATDVARGAALLARLDPALRDRRLALVDKRAADDLRELMSYPPDSAGALMDPRVTAFRIGTTVAEAEARLRALRVHELGTIYLVDHDERLVGAVPLGELAIARPEQRLDELVRGAPASANAFATREEIVEFLTAARLATVPVVDTHGRLIGVIRNQTLLAAAEQEVSADIQTMVGASKDERALSPVPFSVRQRLPWLVFNLATAFFAAFIVTFFTDTIAKITALAVLMPVVAGQSGNSGMQALAVTMRGLALREVRLGHWVRLLLKEAGVGLANGLAIAVVTGLAVFFAQSRPLALVIAASMLISMTIAGISGASIPLGLKALGLDPAQSSSIFLTTVTCAVGLLSFLGLATIFAGFLIGTGP